MLVKCLLCGESRKVNPSVGWKKVEAVCIDCGQPFRAYECHVNRSVHPKRRCDSCQQRHAEGYDRRRYIALRARYRAYWHNVGKYRREVTNPFRHDHDKTTDLTVENGRVNGAVWLERNLGNRHKTRAFGDFYRFLQNGGAKEYAHSCGGTLILINGQHQAYCMECGEKIVKASQNEHYSVMEFACSGCGLVLEA